MKTQPEELKSHWSNPKFDGMPWAIERKRNGGQAASRINRKAEDTANKILLAFDSGGIWPLPPEKFAQVREHVRSILGRAMEDKAEKKRRKWASFQRAMAERKGTT